ncbi:hypothetical protein BD410DRAFT_332154 [Rickenella mellea]|uniref:Uncharacterized protein n=1 Tax=Rickenella mellea TaxID=50990 RepID=A0A4Y7QKE2_9AGAM|nr:hypothetical protein BD410DRAFT_332154 [Rickenella mellea]
MRQPTPLPSNAMTTQLGDCGLSGGARRLVTVFTRRRTSYETAHCRNLKRIRTSKCSTRLIPMMARSHPKALRPILSQVFATCWSATNTLWRLNILRISSVDGWLGGLLLSPDIPASTKKNTLLFFDNEGVAQVPVDGSRTEISWNMDMSNGWALVDLNTNLPKPAFFLTERSLPWPLVMASSPRQSNWLDIEEYGAADVHFMAPWTLQEIIQLRGLRSGSSQGKQPSEMQLSKFYNDFGSSIREVSQFADNTETYKLKLLQKIGALGWSGVFNLLKSAQTNHITREADGDGVIIIVEPRKNDRQRPSASIITKNVLCMLWISDMKDQPSHILSFVSQVLFSFWPKFNKAVVGEIFELHLRNRLSDGITLELQKTVPRPAKQPGYTCFYRANPPSSIFLNRPQLQIASISSMNDFNNFDLTPNIYFTPILRSFQTFDPFVVTKEESQLYINIFGVSVSSLHDLSTERLHFVRDLSMERGMTAKLRYIVVVTDILFPNLVDTLVRMPTEVQGDDFRYEVTWDSFEH